MNFWSATNCNKNNHGTRIKPNFEPDWFWVPEFSLIFLQDLHKRPHFTNIYIYIPRLCLFHVLMVNICIIFRVQHFFRVQITAISGQYRYFYYTSDTPSANQEIYFKSKLKSAQINKKFRGAQRVERGVIY